jgi:SLT domain-containing protein
LVTERKRGAAGGGAVLKAMAARWRGERGREEGGNAVAEEEGLLRCSTEGRGRATTDRARDRRTQSMSGVGERLIGGPTWGVGPSNTTGSRFKPIQFFQTVSNIIQTHSNLIGFKKNLPKLKKFKIKYGFKEFDERNSFPYRNFSRFEIEFEIKIREYLIIQI